MADQTHSFIDTLLHHTSIRAFQDTAVPAETLRTLEDVA